MKGAYVLVMKLAKNSEIKIGKLGEIEFPEGIYCYVGSARGKGVNIENRIARHKKLAKNKIGKVKWHVDYFLTNSNVSLTEAIKLHGSGECKISQFIEQKADGTIHGFGSSDCKNGCKGHLHYFENMSNWENTKVKLK